MDGTCDITQELSRRMLKTSVQQGRSRRKHRRRSLWGYVEDAFEVRTPLAGVFSILLE